MSDKSVKVTLIKSVYGQLASIRGSVRIDNLTNNSYLLLPGLQALPTTATVTVEGTWP